MATPGFYVVWVGTKTGIYESWDQCNALTTSNYSGAQFKKFTTRAEDEKAYIEGPDNYYKKGVANEAGIDGDAALDAIINSVSKPVIAFGLCPIDTAMCVHVAMERKTGDIMYTYDWHMSFGNKDLFRFDQPCPASGVSKNIAEFDALVTGLIMLKNNNYSYPIYTESDAALRYLDVGRIDDMEMEMLKKNPASATIINDKCRWLFHNRNHNPARKWNVRDWGPNPAAPKSFNL